MLKIISFTIFLSIIWVLLSGHYDKLMLSFGVISVVFVIFIASRMKVIDEEGHPVHLILKAPIYWSWLLWQIIVSNILVAKHILSLKLNIDPRLLTIPSNQKSDLDKTNYANSITLTPGTVSILLNDDDSILVHALDQKFENDLMSRTMEKKVKLMSRKSLDQGE
ncbi:Na+/H+ antiporter subunit E [Alphaproteobacteria bacterium]|nr:Na+/H+ antiporter subunit E [Alphaproteobacteria bacterium]